MTLDYETCLALKEAGFPQDTQFCWAKVPNYHPCVFLRSTDGVLVRESDGDSRWEESDAVILCAAPTLSELIDRCGEWFHTLLRCGCDECKWNCYGKGVDGPCAGESCWCDRGVGAHSFNGPTPEAAVAALYLATHGKGNV